MPDEQIIERSQADGVGGGPKKLSCLSRDVTRHHGTQRSKASMNPVQGNALGIQWGVPKDAELHKAASDEAHRRLRATACEYFSAEQRSTAR